jgi:hypothetical protein
MSGACVLKSIQEKREGKESPGYGTKNNNPFNKFSGINISTFTLV